MSYRSVADELPVRPGLAIPLAEIELRASRSSGPGGQHANVTASRVEAVFDVAASETLSDAQKARVTGRLGPRVTATAQDTRSQLRNRELALIRLAERLAHALDVPRPRRATRPTKASKRRRVDAKKRRGDIKRDRRNRPLISLSALRASQIRFDPRASVGGESNQGGCRCDRGRGCCRRAAHDAGARSTGRRRRGGLAEDVPRDGGGGGSLDAVRARRGHGRDRIPAVRAACAGDLRRPVRRAGRGCARRGPRPAGGHSRSTRHRGADRAAHGGRRGREVRAAIRGQARDGRRLPQPVL